MNNPHQFPVYLKYPHNKTFFRIIDETSFDQLDIIGTGYHLYHFKAKVYPDRLLLMDMMDNKGGHWLPSSAAEWEEQLSYCAANLTAI